MNKKYLIIGGVVVAIIVIVGGGFLVTKVLTSSTGQVTRGAFNGGQRNGNSMVQMTTLNGTVINVSNANMTIDAENNQGQKIISLSQNTRITQQESISKDELLQVGKEVAVVGTNNSNNIQASEINLVENTQIGSPASFPTNPDSANGQPNVMRFNGNGNGNGNRVQGQITAISESGFTLTGMNGTTYQITASDKTVYSKLVSLTKADIKAGAKVSIIGSQNGASFSARSINIVK